MPKRSNDKPATRGGIGNFTWEAAKWDKYRENYLGISLKAPLGRSNIGRDVIWYSHAPTDADKSKSGRDRNSKLSSEIEAFKREEAKAMQQKLSKGYVQAESSLGTLSKMEIQEVTKRGAVEQDPLFAERVGGLGREPTVKPDQLGEDAPEEILVVRPEQYEGDRPKHSRTHDHEHKHHHAKSSSSRS